MSPVGRPVTSSWKKPRSTREGFVVALLPMVEPILVTIGRADRKLSRRSVTKRSGCSSAGKCPPRGRDRDFLAVRHEDDPGDPLCGRHTVAERAQHEQVRSADDSEGRIAPVDVTL